MKDALGDGCLKMTVVVHHKRMREKETRMMKVSVRYIPATIAGGVGGRRRVVE